MPLHLAAFGGHAEGVLTLIRAGANRSFRTRTGETALYLAVVRQDMDESKRLTSVGHLLASSKVDVDVAEGGKRFMTIPMHHVSPLQEVAARAGGDGYLWRDSRPASVQPGVHSRPAEPCIERIDAVQIYRVSPKREPD